MTPYAPLLCFLLVMTLFAACGRQKATLAAQGEASAARCTQLVDYYDRYGASRSHNSDGRRNHTRIGAEIDCKRGDYESGISAMEDLLDRKGFAAPPPAGGD